MRLAVRAAAASAAVGLALLVVRPALAQQGLDVQAGAAWSRMEEVGRQSSDLRVKILYSLGAFEFRDGVFHLNEVIAIETLVDEAGGSTDPVVLSLLIDRCRDDLRKAGRCDAVDLARRWTVADTQNQLAWVVLATVLANRGDVDDARVAFRRGAQASQWHEYYPEIARSLASVMPKTDDSKTRAALLLAVVTKSFAGLPSGHYQTISNRCKEVALRDACGRILETMSRDAQSLMTINLAAVLANVRQALPPMTIANLQQRADAMRWAASLNAGRFLDDGSNEAELASDIAYLEALIARTEIDVLRRSLQDRGLRESEAARNYVATLSAEQIARRTNPNGKAASSTN